MLLNFETQTTNEFKDLTQATDTLRLNSMKKNFKEFRDPTILNLNPKILPIQTLEPGYLISSHSTHSMSGPQHSKSQTLKHRPSNKSEASHPKYKFSNTTTQTLEQRTSKSSETSATLKRDN